MVILFYISKTNINRDAITKKINWKYPNIFRLKKLVINRVI